MAFDKADVRRGAAHVQRYQVAITGQAAKPGRSYYGRARTGKRGIERSLQRSAGAGQAAAGLHDHQGSITRQRAAIFEPASIRKTCGKTCQIGRHQGLKCRVRAGARSALILGRAPADLARKQHLHPDHLLAEDLFDAQFMSRVGIAV